MECTGYSRLPNSIFKNDNKEESILDKVKDDKLIIILHELYVNSGFRRTYYLNLDFLISNCGYQVNQKSKKSFETTLNKLKDVKLIDFNLNPKDKITIVNTENLVLGTTDNYFQITDEEIDVLRSIENLRLRMSVLKLYSYLKLSVHKRKIDTKTNKPYDIQVEYKAQVTWQSYDNIEQYTKIGQSHIKEYIVKLKELGLIDYRNLGKKYHSKDKNKRLSECPNVYTVSSINNCGNEQELELGLKQCEYDLKKDGWIITKSNYKNNNRQLNGRKGGLMKKLNNGTITEKQKEELDKLIEKKADPTSMF